MMHALSRLDLAVGAVLCVAVAACADDGSDPTPGAGGATGTGGATTTDSGSAAAPGCHGDAEAWDQIQKSDIPCVDNSDCCVVINDCLGAGQVISADDYPAAGDLWPYCAEIDCVNCVSPVIEVECQHNECVGYELPPDNDGGPYHGESHCGIDEPMGPPTTLGMQFSCGS